jgi:Putative beta-barrel porin-2, OmpL-like. bbp2
MDLKPQSVLQGMAGAVVFLAIVAGAQTTPAPTTPTAPDTTAPATPAATPAAPVWSVGTMDLSGYVDGYFSYNHNRPAGGANYNYNFDDLDQFNLEAAKVTLNHDPDPVGVHVDVIFGRTNTLIHAFDASTNYIEQAYITVKPPKAKGFELDFGQFATSAGQEVIETMSNWSYSHGLLFTDAIPYYHFGIRTSMPVTKTWTAGFQLVNGWNNVTDNNGGVTIGLTSSLVKPKYTWNTNYYVGPENANITPPSYAGTQKGYRNLIDTTFLLTPNAKFNMYVNYDYVQNHTPAIPVLVGYTPSAIKASSRHVQGVAVSARGQITANAALVARYEYLADQGPSTAPVFGSSTLYAPIGTGTKQKLNEFTATYEYKWIYGLLVRAEYRVDWSNVNVFNYGNDASLGSGAPTKSSQNTATIGMIAFFGPKR